MDSKLIMNTSKIARIEFIEEDELMDISVDGDHFFMANDILVKNSFGIPMTLDFFIGLVRTEELDKLNQIMVIQLKSRYDDLTKLKRFVLGVDRGKMKFYDVDESAQNTISGNNNEPSEDIHEYGNGFGLEQLKNRKNFDNIKFD